MNKRTIQYPDTLFIIASIYFFASLLLPIMKYISIVYIDIAAIIVIFLSIGVQNIFKLIRLVLPFTLLLVCQIILKLIKADGLKDIVLIFYSSIYFLIPIIVGHYLISNNYKKISRLLIGEIIVCIIITAITSSIGLKSYPQASRELASGMTDDPRFMLYNSLNIGGFDFTYLIPIVIPMFLFLYKEKRIKLVVLALILYVLIKFIILSLYTTAIIFTVIALLSFFLANNFSFKKVVYISLFGAAFVFFLKSMLGSLLYYFAGTDSGTDPDVALRFMALGEKMMGGETSNEAYLLREEVYNKSIDIFLSDPIFGGLLHGSSNIGGHSYILDFITSFGLLGILALYLAYRQIYRIFYEPFADQRFYGYMVWSLLISIILAILNTEPNIFAISFIIPVVGFLVQEKKEIR